MAETSRATAAAIGLRVKTGRATAVFLAGSAKAPRVLERRAVDLTDPKVPSSRQPYHAGLELPEGENAPVVRQGCEAARRVGLRAMREMLDDLRRAGHTPNGIGLVISSDSDPGALKNAHIRAHALEGILFRDVLEAAAATCGVRCLVILERQAYERAAPLFGVPVNDLKRSIAELGALLPKPWGAEEKTATLAAWLALRAR